MGSTHHWISLAIYKLGTVPSLCPSHRMGAGKPSWSEVRRGRCHCEARHGLCHRQPTPGFHPDLLLWLLSLRRQALSSQATRAGLAPGNSDLCQGDAVLLCPFPSSSSSSPGCPSSRAPWALTASKTGPSQAPPSSREASWKGRTSFKTLEQRERTKLLWWGFGTTTEKGLL